MKEDVKDRWVEALRSGDYRQCVGKLSFGGRHCCLGVLCEVLGVEKRASGLGGVVEYGSMGAWTYLPEEAIKLADINEGLFFGASARPSAVNVFTLSSMNDGGESFEAIADVIEANWQAL